MFGNGNNFSSKLTVSTLLSSRAFFFLGTSLPESCEEATEGALEVPPIALILPVKQSNTIFMPFLFIVVVCRCFCYKPLDGMNIEKYVLVAPAHDTFT